MLRDTKSLDTCLEVLRLGIEEGNTESCARIALRLFAMEASIQIKFWKALYHFVAVLMPFPGPTVGSHNRRHGMGTLFLQMQLALVKVFARYISVPFRHENQKGISVC